MYKYEKEFREENPQTINETDKHFDLDNYKDWLELKIEKDKRKNLKDFLEYFESEVDFLPCEPELLIENYFNSL